ncbi:MAG: hypothetical protein ABI885_29450 [Gammaproteobacteria bacterium]
MADNRPTATWKLWALGAAGGIALSVAMFTAGGDGDQMRDSARTVGNTGFRILALAVLIGGGWAALRKRR